MKEKEIFFIDDIYNRFTGGGIALCATCQVQVFKGTEHLPPLDGQELDMLDTLPNADVYSRLSRQLRINKEMDGMIFRIADEN